LLGVDLVADGWRAVCARYPDVDQKRLRSELIRQQIGHMVNDVIGHTRTQLLEAGVRSPDDVRHAGKTLADFSPAMSAREKQLKRFMYSNLYHHPRQLEVATLARQVVKGLFEVLIADPTILPDFWRLGLPDASPGRERHIVDFIAGMTDRFAISSYRKWIGQIELPDMF
jgi:dGTPase